MKNNLQTLLKRFDEKWDINSDWVNEDKTETSGGDYAVFDKDKIKAFLVESIKDALEAVRVEKQELPSKESLKVYPCGEAQVMGHNFNTTQYDENVRKYLEEEEV